MNDIIIPPKPIQQLIEKTIPSILKYQDLIIKKILDRKDPKFDFLKDDSPFHSYYLLCMEKAQADVESKDHTAPNPLQNTQLIKPVLQSKPQPQTRKILPPSFTYKPPPDIGSLQLDVIHLAAQYGALYGREFLQALLKQKQQEPLFDFMKPGKPYFALFSSLVEQYKLAIDPSPLLKARLKNESESIQNIRENLIAEAENQKQIEEQKKNEANETKESEENSLYDWDNFIVMGTIDYEDDNDISQQNEDDNREMVKTTLKTQKQIMQISPITGQSVPIEEFGNHLKFERQHPQYQKDEEMMKERKRDAYNSLATGSQIAENLKAFAEGDSKKPEQHQYIWDGRQETIPQAVAHAVRSLDEEPQPRPDLKKKKPIIGPVPTVTK